jgi:TolB-like protein
MRGVKNCVKRIDSSVFGYLCFANSGIAELTIGGSLKVRLCLWGTFRLFAKDGARVDVPSKKGMALMALLATAPDGERTRSWLQDRLWGSRQRPQAQQSLRRELASLKAVLPDEIAALFSADRERVRLDPSKIEVDAEGRDKGATFLEGFDMPGEDGFEEWLRDQRQLTIWQRPAAQEELTPPLPRSVIDLSAPAPTKYFGSKPAIAVLPFVSITGSADGEIWAEGMTEDLVERLSRLRWLPVIAPSTMVELSGRDLDASAIGAMVGAAYLLRGRLVQRADALALQLYLLDGNNGQLLWSERIVLPDGVTQKAMAELANELVGILDSRIDSEEQARVINRHVDELNYNEVLWRARWHLNRLTRADAAIARDLLTNLLEAQPNSADVLIQCAFSKAWDIWSARLEENEVVQFRALALRAMAADSFDGRGYMLAGMAEMWLGNHALANSHYHEALCLNPSLARAHAQLGSNNYLAGDPESAFDPLRNALRLSPLDNQVFYVLGEFAVANCMLGEYAEAVRYADLAIARRPAYFFAHVSKINGLIRNNQRAAAQKALQALHKARPGFLPSDLDWLPFAERRWNEFLKEGVAQAEAD